MSSLKDLVFATILSELKASWGEVIADPDLINLLYDSVTEPTELLNKNGEPITVSKGTASKIVNRQTGGNPNQSVRNNSADSRVLRSIEAYFASNVVKRLLSGSEDDLIQRLREIINEDTSIADSKKQELLLNGQKKTLAKFLASVYLYSLTRDNVLTIGGKPPVSASKELDPITTPPSVVAEERNYTDALLTAYGQVEGIRDFTMDMLDTYPVHYENFSAQRKYYYAAEAVRRGTRDLYGIKDTDQFDVLKDEMFEGVTEVWEDEAKNGISRMRKVMAQATRTSLSKCRICRDTEWIGNTQRKGVCHFLVRENRLKGWVRDDDEQSI